MHNRSRKPALTVVRENERRQCVEYIGRGAREVFWGATPIKLQKQYQEEQFTYDERKTTWHWRRRLLRVLVIEDACDWADVSVDLVDTSILGGTKHLQAYPANRPKSGDGRSLRSTTMAAPARWQNVSWSASQTLRFALKIRISAAADVYKEASGAAQSVLRCLIRATLRSFAA